MDARKSMQNGSTSQPKTVDAWENVQSPTNSQGFKAVDVRKSVQEDSGEMKEKT